MLTQSQRGEIAKCDPDIKKVCHRNNAKIRRRKMVVDGEQEHLIRLPHPLCRNHYSHTAPQSGRSKLRIEAWVDQHDLEDTVLWPTVRRSCGSFEEVPETHKNGEGPCQCSLLDRMTSE